MDPKLYEAVRNGNIASMRELAKSNSSVLHGITTQKDNILHVAAKYDRNQMAEEIIKSLPFLANQNNSKGDTPLHIAARLGSLKTSQILMKYGGEIEEGNERLTRVVNMEKDTALHDAARNGHLKIAELLIKEDPELTRLTNNVGESPLFVAVDKNYVDIAKHIIEVAQGFSVEGRNNMNALHAAAIRSKDEVIGLLFYLNKLPSFINYAIDMPIKDYMKVFPFIRPSIQSQAASRDSSYKDFIVRLMEKRRFALSQTDEYEWTPLHYAVQCGEVGIVKLFLRKINSSTAHIRDKEGMSVVHIAAREGEVIKLKMLANKFPEIWDLQDNKGQTALHLAVARGKLDSVKFILGTPLSHHGLINQQDNEGNTALHLTAIKGDHGKIFELLIKDKRVNKTATNMQGLTVLDILLLKKDNYFVKIWTTIGVASSGGLQSLEHKIDKNGKKTRSIETKKPEQSQQSKREEPVSDTQEEGQRAEPLGLKKFSPEQLQNISSTNLLVTTLIATVSFAAAFTMPGGYKSDGPDEGMAILSRKSAFKAFVIANTLAFSLSTTSMFLHHWQSFMEKLDVLSSYISLSTFFTSYAVTAMVIAFVSGTYAALADSPGLAKAVLSIGCCSFFGIRIFDLLN